MLDDLPADIDKPSFFKKGSIAASFRDKNPKKMKDGGGLRDIPEGNKGLPKLPTEVRNKMGYMKKGGKVMKMRGGGAATRGVNYKVM